MAIATTTIIAAAALAATAVGTYVSYQAANQQADAQKNQLQYQAAVAQNNQTVANQNADYAKQEATFTRQQADATRAAGDIAAQNKLMEAGQKTASIRAAAGASGVDPNSGSPVALQSDSEKLGTLDALTIRSNAERTAYGQDLAARGYDIQASGDVIGGINYSTQAQIYQTGAANAGAAGALSASSSLLSGASSVSDKWQKYQNAGAFA